MQAEIFAALKCKGYTYIKLYLLNSETIPPSSYQKSYCIALLHLQEIDITDKSS